VKIKDLHALTGGLSTPSKMPGFAYSISAKRCLLGAILVKKDGSVCHDCYALKGRYVFPVVQAAMERRFEAIQKPEWVSWMVELIQKKYRNRSGSERVFRWHDSGDIQGPEHLSKIVEIAKAIPDIDFWLPTRERKIIALWTLGNGDFPSNLTVRVSQAMIGQEAMGNYFYPQSTVGAEGGFQCPAHSQDNECRDCRACWDSEIRSINYSPH